MTVGNEPDPALRPAWQRRPAAPAGGEPPAQQPPPPPPAPAPAEEPAPDPDDLERGRTLALVAALGRLQMSLDVLNRQQQKHYEQVEQRLARIERRLGAPPSPGNPQ